MCEQALFYTDTTDLCVNAINQFCLSDKDVDPSHSVTG